MGSKDAGVFMKEGAMSDRIVGYALCLTGFAHACGLVWLVSWLL
jgi:hypothetical protein